MNLKYLLIIICIIVIFFIWREYMKARENALFEAIKTCKQWGAILLDDTVSLSKIRLKRINGTFRIHREYSFDYTYEGSKRYQAFLIFYSYQLMQIISNDNDIVPDEVQSDTAVSESDRKPKNNIIDFKK